MIVTSLGVACAVIGTVLAFPQLVRIVRHKTVAGVSLVAWQVWTGVGSAWVLHGIWASDPIVIVPNVVGATVSAAIIALVGYHNALSPFRVWGPALAWAVSGIGVRLLIGPLAFGLVMIVPQYVAVAGQLFDVVTKRDVRGVSGPYLVMALSVQSCWFAYGLLKPDSAVAACSGAMTLISGLTLGWYVARALGAPAWRARSDEVTNGATVVPNP